MPFIHTGSVQYKTVVSPLGHFEITEGNTVLVEGMITEGVANIQNVQLQNNDNGSHHSVLLSKDIYQIIRLRGYDYGPQCQGIQSYNTKSRKIYILQNVTILLIEKCWYLLTSGVQ